MVKHTNFNQKIIEIINIYFKIGSFCWSFARNLDLTTDGQEWQCSNGFLHRFCQHYAFISKKLTGEGLDCPDYTDFLETILKPLLQEYEPNDIYNANKTNLFY